MVEERHQELGRPYFLLEVKGKIGQRYEGDLKGFRESDYLIVLRDGRAVHTSLCFEDMGKGVAKRCSSQRKQVPDA